MAPPKQCLPNTGLGIRDTRLDFVRSLCLMIMCINHLPAMPLQKVTYETLGFITSAEGFVLISGLTAGWVYSKSGGVPVRRILARAVKIYAAYAALMTLYLFWEYMSENLRITAKTWLLDIAGQHPPTHAAASILLIYTIMFLCLPFVLRLFQADRAYLVLGASFGLWLLGQLRIGPVLSFGYLFSWQFLFILGAWAGYCRARGIQIPGSSSLAITYLVLFAFAVLFFFRHPIVRPPVLNLGWEITNKIQLGIVRVVDVSLLALLLGRIPQYLGQQWLGERLYRAACYLGRHSLAVFSGHAIVIWAIAPYQAQWTKNPLLTQLCLTALVLASLFLVAYIDENWRFRPIRKYLGPPVPQY